LTGKAIENQKEKGNQISEKRGGGEGLNMGGERDWAELLNYRVLQKRKGLRKMKKIHCEG